MELIGVIFVLFLLYGGWRIVLNLITAAGGAAVDAAKGRSSFGEAVSARTRGMSALEMKVESSTVGEEELPVWKVKVRGLFHIVAPTKLTVVISLLDITEKGNPHPILSAFDEFQEPETRAFQFVRDLGICEPGQGFLHWVDVGVVPKDLLMYPYKGDRKIAVIARVVDKNQMPKILRGFSESEQPGNIQHFIHSEIIQVERGFLERSDEDLGIAAASVRLGLALAYSDGSFDPLEGRLIKEWAAKFVNEVPEGQGRAEARSYINDAIRYGNEDAKNSNLSITNQVDVLNELAGKPEKYAAIELCLDVMAADGTADQEELKMLNKLCDSLGLDSDRFSELRDHRMIHVESAHVDGANIWDTLGIDLASSDEVKKNKLKQLYRRWNSRAESLEDKAEREKAHEMLELIAEARSLLNA
ncbi:tellurite resistance TerB family protein [Pseudomonadota bacterium]